MPAANWSTLEPTAGTPGSSYEFGLDIFVGAAWLNIPDITALNPTFTPKTRARSTYAAKGKTNALTVQRDVSFSVQIEIVRDISSQYQAELNAMIALAEQVSQSNIGQFRIFDTTGADWAWQGKSRVEQSLANTGSDDDGFFGFDCASYGTWTPITNPVGAGTAPGVASVSPAGAAATTQVLIKGVRFTGATGVTIGGVAATGVRVIDDFTIIATVPAGSAGSAPVVVTTASGSSTALPYTRG